MPVGGFSLSDALQEYGQLERLTEFMKAKREKERQMQLGEQNLGPDALMDWQKFRESQGPLYRDDPAMVEQFLNTRTPRRGYQPGQREQLRTDIGAQQSRAVQARKLDFQKQ